MQILDQNFAISAISEAGTFTGIASDPKMNRNGWAYAPGAFALSLSEHKQRGTMPALLLHHDKSRPAGRWERIETKDDGLHVSGKLALDTRDGSEAYALLKAGALTGLSTGCYHQEVTPVAGGRGSNIIRADLVEVSLVTIPANPNGNIVRVNSLSGPRDLEDLMREAGLSSRKAKAGAAAAWKAINIQPDSSDAELASILSSASDRLARFKGTKS